MTTMNEYQARATSTAKYPQHTTGSITALAYVSLGLGEVGEFQGKVKKIMRDDNGVITPEKRVELSKELGDVLWYVAMAAMELGYTLEDVADENLKKLAQRKAAGTIGGSGDNR